MIVLGVVLIVLALLVPGAARPVLDRRGAGHRWPGAAGPRAQRPPGRWPALLVLTQAAPMRAPRVCSTPGCPRLTQSGGRCDDCARRADRDRGTATERGYTSAGHRAFRVAVLDRDPICVVCQLAASTVADHWPLSRRDLLEQGSDPNDPAAGRGLCSSCHNRSTARHQPGGWHSPIRQ